MNDILIILPNQLFKFHPALIQVRKVVLVEEFLFFKQFNFHKQKLMLHRASMKSYQIHLKEIGCDVEYIESASPYNNISELIGHLADQGIQNIHMAEVVDDWLLRRIINATKKVAVSVKFYRTPGFLNSMADVENFFNSQTSYFQRDFYIWQRKKNKLLLEAGEKPIGGKWSFDAENRKRLPKDEVIPIVRNPGFNKMVEEAANYIQINFKNNYGFIDDFIYPVNFKEAADWFDDFLINRFNKFGLYEDAMSEREHYLFHAVLSPILNTGLITPREVLEKVQDISANRNIHFNSLEGFIRQITGWREFVRIVYEREGARQRTTNFWGFSRKIPKSFWTGETGIGPIDILINKILKTGYCHHIERLMVLGNFMLLCEFDPDEVYRWFMELFVDSFDWVMVPNIYGMSQFSDGGMMTTKPYISGSNYLNKMGDWGKVCKDNAWQATWDGLFWRFMHVQRKYFLQNPRLGMLVGTFDRMSAEKKSLHLKNADNYLKLLDTVSNES